MLHLAQRPFRKICCANKERSAKLRTNGTIYEETKMLVAKIIFTVSYLLVIVGSSGMVVFAIRFPLASSIWELKHAKERFLRLNGYQVWVFSWFAILFGTVGQIIATWCS